MNKLYPHFEMELATCRMRLEGKGRKAFVLGIIAEPGADSKEGHMARSVSGDTSRLDALVFIAGLEREIARIKRLIGEKT